MCMAMAVCCSDFCSTGSTGSTGCCNDHYIIYYIILFRVRVRGLVSITSARGRNLGPVHILGLARALAPASISAVSET